MRPSKLDISQKKQVIDLYLNEKISTTKIAKLFKVNSETIRNTLLSQNIKLRNKHESKIIGTTFSFVEMSKDKAFLLGLIYGDGSISNRKDYFNITSGDLDLLEKVKNILGNKFKITKVKSYYRGYFCSRKICDELYNLFGLTNNKSDKLIFPKLDNEYMSAFISGYLAADGCISGKSLIFYSCSKQFLEDLNQYLCSKNNLELRNLYIRIKLKDHFGDKPIYVLVFNGQKAKKVCNYIFKDLPNNLVSDRKHNLFLQL